MTYQRGRWTEGINFFQTSQFFPSPLRSESPYRICNDSDHSNTITEQYSHILNLGEPDSDQPERFSQPSVTKRKLPARTQDLG